MRNYLFLLYAFITKNKFLSIGIVIALFLFLAFFATRISFQENINQLTKYIEYTKWIYDDAAYYHHC